MAATLTKPFDADDVVLSTSATLIFTSTNRATVDHPETIIVQSVTASAVVTVGPSNVADGSNGTVLPNQYDTITIEFNSPGTEVYAIAAAATPTVTVSRTS